MAGIWEIIKSNLSPSEERLHAETVSAGIVLHATAPGTFTKARIRDIINDGRTTNLTLAEEADLSDIVDNLNAEVGATNKLIYQLKVVSYFAIAEAATSGGGTAITETEFRNGLGI